MSIVATVQIGPVAVVAAVAVAWESVGATVVVAVVQIVVEVRVCLGLGLCGSFCYCLSSRSSFSIPLANVVVVVAIEVVGDSIGMAVDGGWPVDCGRPVELVAVGAVGGKESVVVERKVGISFGFGLSISPS